VIVAKLLIDECIGQPHALALAQMVALDRDVTVEIEHVLKYQSQGTWDEVWIPELAKEWLVITHDRGRRRRGKGLQLSKVCLEHGISHVILGAAVAQRKSFHKLLTLMSVWYEVLAVAREAPGARYIIEPASNRPEDYARGKIICRTPPSGKRHDGTLFDKTE
jgi:hypothetical protein